MKDLSARPIRIALYDDNDEFCKSMKGLFASFEDLQFLEAYPNAAHILDNCNAQKPDVILMDIDMPGLSGIEAVRLLRTQYPCIKVLMLTVFDENHKIFESICNGADGYMLKKSGPIAILDAVREAYHNGAPMSNSIAAKVLHMFRTNAQQKNEGNQLSDREKEILSHLTKGFTYKMIAAECQISIDTVRFHIKNIYDKLHVHSMTEAVSKALKNKWV